MSSFQSALYLHLTEACFLFQKMNSLNYEDFNLFVPKKVNHLCILTLFQLIKD